MHSAAGSACEGAVPRGGSTRPVGVGLVVSPLCLVLGGDKARERFAERASRIGSSPRR